MSPLFLTFLVHVGPRISFSLQLYDLHNARGGGMRNIVCGLSKQSTAKHFYSWIAATDTIYKPLYFTHKTTGMSRYIHS